MKARPGPMVSGSDFFPKAPLLWVKWIPACAVMSRKWICWAWLVSASDKANNHGDTEARRKMREKGFRFSPYLCASVVSRLSGVRIYLEAPAEVVVDAGRALPGWTAEAAVPTCFAVDTGRLTDTCSCTAWRSLLSSGCNWRYGPVMACDDS